MRVSFQSISELATSKWEAARETLGDEFRRLQSTINNIWQKEHKEDGTHSDITADSVSTNGAPMGVVTNLNYDSARYLGYGGTWTVDSGDQIFLRMSRIGQMAWVEFGFEGTAITVSTPDYLMIRIPELFAITQINPASLTGQGFPHAAGNAYYIDVTNATQGNATPFCRADSVNSLAATTIYLARYDAPNDQWPTTSDLKVYGSIWFPITVNNAIEPYV